MKMNEYVALTTILLLGVAFGLFGRLALINLVVQIAKIKKIIATNKAFKAKEMQVAMMKAKGEFHQWKELPDGNGNTLTVCIKTGWCPSLKGFIPMEAVNRTLEDIRTIEEYKTFRDARVIELALLNNMTNEEMEKIVESVFDIKKQFHLKRLQDLSDSMKNRKVNLDVRIPSDT
jgi:hypothetical protein